jgi:tRNA (uracil-5-)-methyltransferase
LQYGYRTKITPHFDAPPKRFQKKGPPSKDGAKEVEKQEWLKIGFNHVGQRQVMDIEVGINCLLIDSDAEMKCTEDCPIATPVIAEAYGPIREEIIKSVTFLCQERYSHLLAQKYLHLQERRVTSAP